MKIFIVKPSSPKDSDQRFSCYATCLQCVFFWYFLNVSWNIFGNFFLHKVAQEKLGLGFFSVEINCRSLEKNGLCLRVPAICSYRKVPFGLDAAQKLKFFNKDFFSQYDQLRSFLRIWSHLLKKVLLEEFNFCAVRDA